MFDEVRFDLRLTPDGSLSVHSTSRVLPEEWADTVSAAQLEQLRALRERLAKHQITEAELVHMGLLLGDALVPESIQQPLVRHVAAASDRRVRMRIVTHDPELGALPWEYVRLPSRYDELGGSPLALNERVSLVRSPSKGASPTSPTLRGSSELRVLHASATSVQGFDPLRGDDHAVDLALWGDSGNRRTRRVVVDRLSDPASRSSLEEALSSRPDLLVFTGHSTSEGGRSALVLADEDGRPDLVGGAELAAMLLRAGTPLVVLNACDTATSDDEEVSLAEQLVRSGVGIAIGMQMPISDSNAGHFAVGLVSALGEGLPVDTAVTHGRRRVAERAGYAEWGIPTLVASSRLESPRPAPAEELRSRPAPLVGAASSTTTRGGPSSGPDGTASRSSEEDDGRSRRPLVGALAIALLALVGGGLWFALSDDDEPSEASVAGETTVPTPAASELPADGFFGAKTLTQTSLSDTSTQLMEKVDAFAERTRFPGVRNVLFTQTVDQREHGAPTPFHGGFASTNHRHNPECWKVLLNDVTVLGAAGRIWTDGTTGVLLNAMELDDATTAEQYYWATALYLGQRPSQCDGWPENGLAEDPERLSVRRMDFDVNGPADDLNTAITTSVDVNGVLLKTAYRAVFRNGTTVVVAIVGSVDDTLDEDAAASTISDAMRAFGE